MRLFYIIHDILVYKYVSGRLLSSRREQPPKVTTSRLSRATQTRRREYTHISWRERSGKWFVVSSSSCTVRRTASRDATSDMVFSGQSSIERNDRVAWPILSRSYRVLHTIREVIDLWSGFSSRTRVCFVFRRTYYIYKDILWVLSHTRRSFGCACI